MKTSPDQVSEAGFLRLAVQKFPLLNWAIGTGGIAAIVSIVVGFSKVDLRIIVLGSVVVVLFMVVLLVFAKLARAPANTLRKQGIALAWFATALVMLCGFGLASSVFFAWPLRSLFVGAAKEQPHALLIENTRNSVFDNVTVEGPTIIRDARGDFFLNFQIRQNQEKENEASLQAFDTWRANVREHAGSVELVKQDFNNLRTQFGAVRHITPAQMERWNADLDKLEQTFIEAGNDKQRTLGLLDKVNLKRTELQ